MSTNWAELDTELSETTTPTETTNTTAIAVGQHPDDERPVDLVDEHADPDLEVDAEGLVDDVDEDFGEDFGVVDEDMPAGGGFGLDVSDGRLGAALVFATVSLIGVGLGSFASLLAAPIVVMVAVWGIAALAGLLAVRQLIGGGAR